MDWWQEVERALENVPHAVAGAVATNAYAPERLTQDIDIVVLASEAHRAEAALRAAGWRKTGNLSLVRGTSWRDIAGHDVDLITLTEPWAIDAVTEAQENRIAGMATLPMAYVVLMKLFASRTTDLGDVTRMLGWAADSRPELVDQARHVVQRFGTAEDLADFEQLLDMGRLERGLDRGGQTSETL